MQLDQFQHYPLSPQHMKVSPKSLSHNRVPMWLFTGQFTQEVKQEIIAGRLPINHEEEVYLVRYLMEAQKERHDRTQKLLLKKLLMSGDVCQHLKYLPFELVLHFLEVEVYPKNHTLLKAGEFCDKVLLLIQGTLEVISSLNEVSTVEGSGSFGEKEVHNNVKSDIGLRARTECCFLVIRRPNYNTAVRKYRFIELKEIEAFLMMVPIVRTFGEDVIKKLAQVFDRVELTSKEVIVKQNEQPQHIWIVVEGQLKSTFTNYYDQQCNLVYFGQYDIIGLESILKQLSPLNISCSSEMVICYRVSTEKLLRVLKDCTPTGYEESPHTKQLKELMHSKLQNYKEMIAKYNGRIGIVRLARVRRNRQNRDNSKNSEGKNYSQESSKQSHNGEDLRLKTKYFSKNLASTTARQVTNSAGLVSWTIRSKKDQPKNLYDLYQSPEDCPTNTTEPVNPMMEAYKEKLKRTTTVDVGSNVQLDIIDKLYRRSRRSKDAESPQHYPSAAPRSRQKQTEILMKRIQMTSCRKRRNKQVCLFNPQQVIDFARTTTFS